jgi:hypothetical protein
LVCYTWIAVIICGFKQIIEEINFMTTTPFDPLTIAKYNPAQLGEFIRQVKSE